MVAASGHDGQFYGDRPYIFHPVQVAEAMKLAGGTEDEVIACLLHDVVEDSKDNPLALTVTLPDIEETFGFDVAAMVAGVTHDDDVTYEDYMAQMPASSRRIKFFDSLCNFINLNDFRSALPEMKRSKLMVRYSRNLVTLLPAVADMNLDPAYRLLVEEIGAAYNEVAPT